MAVFWNVLVQLPAFIFRAMIMEAVSFPETSVSIYNTLQRKTPEDSYIQLKN
jgi:hypothetical protein